MPLAVGRTFSDQRTDQIGALEQLVDGDIQRRNFRRVDRRQWIRRSFHRPAPSGRWPAIARYCRLTAIGVAFASGRLALPLTCWLSSCSAHAAGLRSSCTDA